MCPLIIHIFRIEYFIYICEQETKEYELKIRQHVDLQMVSSKLQQRLYSHDHLLFFRDLLLLCTNATVFFPPTSDEFAAAVGLRRIITREMGIAIRKSRSVAGPPPFLQRKSDPGDTLSSSPEKPTSSSKSKKTQAKAETEAVEMKEADHLSENTAAEPLVFKKKRKERSATGLRGARSGRGRGATSSTVAATTAAPAKAAPPVTDKPDRNASSSSVAKKRSAASFLNRMKRNTPSGTLLDTLKASADASPSGSGGAGAESKKGGSHGGRRAASAGKQAAAAVAEQGSPATPKRSVGRPPKKTATRSSQGRGRREGVEAAAKQQGRKRGRR